LFIKAKIKQFGKGAMGELQVVYMPLVVSFTSGGVDQ